MLKAHALEEELDQKKILLNQQPVKLPHHLQRVDTMVAQVVKEINDHLLALPH